MKMRNKFASRCTACGGHIPAETWIEYDREQRMPYHESCAPAIVVNSGKVDARFNVITTQHTSNTSNTSNNGLTTTKPSTDAPVTTPTNQTPSIDAINTTLQTVSTMLEQFSRSVTHLSSQTADTKIENQQLQTRLADLARKLTDLENRPQKVAEIIIKQQDTSKTITGTFHYKLPQLLRLAASLDVGERNVWLTGPAGSGKTTAAHQVAKVLNLPFEFHGAIDTPYKLSGYMDATGCYRETSFRRIYQHGGIILLDECDASSPAALLEINAATANGWASFPDGIIERHPNCYVICAANTYGFGGDANYVGRARLDAAFLDRFVTVTWPYDEDLERSIALDDAWTTVVQSVRKKVFELGAQLVVSPRASIKGGQLLAGGCSRQEVIEAIFGRYRQHSAWSTIGQAAERWCHNA